jgi:glutathione S-transferase
MKLYYFPLSTYSQKTLIALYEKGVDFTPQITLPSDPPEVRAAYRKLNPLGKVPTLVLDDGHVIPESTIIIEYLEDHHGASGTRLIPTDSKDRARQTRFHDRQWDLYFNQTMQTIFFDGRKPADQRNPAAVAAARATLDVMYPIYDEHMAKRTWVMGDDFTMADCAAAPCLSYLRMLHPFEQHKHLAAYTARLTERPSFARVLAEAAPFMAKMMAG